MGVTLLLGVCEPLQLPARGSYRKKNKSPSVLRVFAMKLFFGFSYAVPCLLSLIAGWTSPAQKRYRLECLLMLNDLYRSGA